MKTSTISAFCTMFAGALGISAISTLPSWTTDPTAGADFDKCMEKMHGEMQKACHSGSVDVDFASMMIPHHESAIEMSKVELRLGTDPRLRRLAQEMIVNQQSEIEVLAGALRDTPLSSLDLKRKNWCAP